MKTDVSPADGRGIAVRRAPRGVPFTAPLFLLLFFLILFPIGTLLLGTFSKSSPRNIDVSPSNFTLDNLERVAGSGTIQRATVDTLLTVAGGALFAMAIAIFFAWLVARTDVPMKRWIAAGALAPLFISPLVAAISWYMLAAPFSGFLNIFLRDAGIDFTINISSKLGVAFVMGTTYAPYAYLLILTALKGMDATFEEASSVCGASTRQTLSRITAPMVSPAVYGAVFLISITLLGLYAIPFIIGEPGGLLLLTSYVARLIFQSPPDYQAAATIGLFLIVLTGAALLAQNRLLRRRQYVTVTGKAYRPRNIPLGRWRIPLCAVAMAFLFVAVLLPLIAVLYGSLSSRSYYSSASEIFGVTQFSLENFRQVFASPLLSRSITNSFVVGAITAVLGVLLSSTIVYIRRRTDFVGRGLLDVIATMPLAIPGIIIGVAFLWGWVSLPIGLYGTLGILIAAYIAHHLPSGVRSVDSTLLQISPELEEAARVTGASTGRRLARIVVPLTSRGLLASGTLFFVFSMRELGSVLFLYNSDTTVMAVQVLDSWSRGQVGAATALAVIQAVTVAAFVGIARSVLDTEIL